jgi:hypothetical protein
VGGTGTTAGNVGTGFGAGGGGGGGNQPGAVGTKGFAELWAFY